MDGDVGDGGIIMKKAFITGITGQDGSYLSEFLLSQGYEIHGLVRRSSSFNRGRIDHLYMDQHNPSCHFFLHYGDIADSGHLTNLLHHIKPDEVYHLGAQSHVQVSFELPEYTGDIVGLGTIRILEAIRNAKLDCKFYQASSSEMFGSVLPPQNEETVFHPQSPYAVAKVMAYHTVNNYRDAYGIFACNGILFNHESPRRGESFVTRKITFSLARILAKKQNKIYLGNLAAKRDWGFTPDYIEVMWQILQQKNPDNYVIGTGETHSVEDFLREAFSYVDLDYRKYVETDRRYLRPLEVDHLRADISKAQKVLGFQPRVKFSELVKIMVDADMLREGLKPIGEGLEILKNKNFSWIRNTQGL